MRIPVVRLEAAARLLLASAVVVVVSGCGAGGKVSAGSDEPDEPAQPKTLAGATLASRANTQLEKENSELVHGDLTCADVELEIGATSRCLRTVVLDDGRLVRIGATATIDRVKDSGHFQITVDDAPQEFGIVGKAVFDDLSKQYAARYKSKRPTGSCPAYLPGRKGARMTCTLVTKDGRLRVQVRVTGADPANFNTTYTYRALN